MGAEGKNHHHCCGLRKEKGTRAPSPKTNTETWGALGMLPLTQSVVDAVCLFFHGLVQALQILHEQCNHLPIHLQPQESKRTDGYVSQLSPQNVPIVVLASLLNKHSKPSATHGLHCALQSNCVQLCPLGLEVGLRPGKGRNRYPYFNTEAEGDKVKFKVTK